MTPIVFRVGAVKAAATALSLVLCIFVALSPTATLAFAPTSTTRAAVATSNPSTTKLSVASAESRSVDISDLGRGMGGRIEEAFAAAKSKGEAAFVTFVTAGYPTKEGMYYLKMT